MIAYAGEDAEYIPLLLVRVQTLEISMVVSQKIVSQLISTPSNTTLGHIPKDAPSY